MGAWGHGIRQDDFVCDVIGDFDDLLKAGKSVVDATMDLMSRFSAEINDTDNGPLFWIALADAQWTYGGLESQVLQRVQDDFNSGRGLDRWIEDKRAFARRQDAIRKWLIRTHHSWNHAIDLAWYLPVGFRSAKNPTNRCP